MPSLDVLRIKFLTFLLLAFLPQSSSLTFSNIENAKRETSGTATADRRSNLPDVNVATISDSVATDDANSNGRCDSNAEWRPLLENWDSSVDQFIYERLNDNKTVGFTDSLVKDFTRGVDSFQCSPGYDHLTSIDNTGRSKGFNTLCDLETNAL